jgi:hypothetical protein
VKFGIALIAVGVMIIVFTAFFGFPAAPKIEAITYVDGYGSPQTCSSLGGICSSDGITFTGGVFQDAEHIPPSGGVLVINGAVEIFAPGTYIYDNYFESNQ